jgi:hypothetical protein
VCWVGLGAVALAIVGAASSLPSLPRRRQRCERRVVPTEERGAAQSLPRGLEDSAPAEPPWVVVYGRHFQIVWHVLWARTGSGRRRLGTGDTSSEQNLAVTRPKAARVSSLTFVRWCRRSSLDALLPVPVARVERDNLVLLRLRSPSIHSDSVETMKGGDNKWNPVRQLRRFTA